MDRKVVGGFGCRRDLGVLETEGFVGGGWRSVYGGRLLIFDE